MFLTKKRYDALMHALHSINVRLDKVEGQPEGGAPEAEKPANGVTMRSAVAAIMLDGKVRSAKQTVRDIRKNGHAPKRMLRQSIRVELARLCREGKLERVKHGMYRQAEQ